MIMEIVHNCKLQLCILIILFFASYLFVKDGNRLNKKSNEVHCNPYFDKLFVLGEIAVLFDGITACTVNYLNEIPDIVNLILHFVHFAVYQAFVFCCFMYWLSITDYLPKTKAKKLLCYLPIILFITATFFTMNQIVYETGTVTKYPSGVPLFITYISIAVYGLLLIALFIVRKNYIQKNKRVAFIVAFSVMCTILVAQVLYHETLIASISIALVLISIYLCSENPSIKFLELYHDEMIMGFATLVESRDSSTGGHIKRSASYTVLIANELRKWPKYKEYITKDYITNIKKASYMHDIGKIGIPDDILQKPGKLTAEEYEIMKTHSVIGSEIIKKTFGHLDDEDYENMTFDLTLNHHEKWNGKGYPHRVSGEDIPLCARIMAVADVFDAVSAKRCYRDAMPIEACYKIISDGRGEDFDPDVVDAFFACKNKIEKVYHSV